MKKFLTLLLTLFSVGAALGQTYIEVGTLEDLQRVISENNSAMIKLTDNIDISGLKAPLCETFRGVIDGSFTAQKGNSTLHGKHRIYGGTTTVEMVLNIATGEEMPKVTSRTRTTCSHLFEKLEHATIKNVEFCNIRVEDDDNDELGVIARTAFYTEFNEVSMDYCSVFCDENRAGTLVGYAQECTFQLVNTRFCDVKVNGVEAGGLVGHSNTCKFEMCVTSFDTSVFADGNNNKATGWCGGFVGYSKFDEFYGDINGAFVGADESQVGGYAGESVGSNFTSCQNQGTVAHMDYSDFEKARYDRNKKLADLEYSPEKLGWIVGGSVSGGLGVAFIISMMLSEDLAWYVYEFIRELFAKTWAEFAFGGLDNISFWWFGSNEAVCLSEFIPFSLSCAIVLAAVATAIEVGIAIYNGDDEVGGISGLARGGAFEQCQNYGELYCRDDNAGGIVGWGYGVTINNCANYGAIYFEHESTAGGILGQAEKNPDDNNKKCKVTNCFARNRMHVVGTSGYEDAMDPTSGNNYREDANDIEGVDCEMPVDIYQFEEGYVTLWLNQGIENRSKGEKPWRLGEIEKGNHKAKVPLLDPSKPELQIADIRSAVHISSADDLIAYREAVEKNQFTCGVLEADIDMSDYKWTPIGRDGFFTNFRGFFDGQGHTISGLRCESSEAVGLFGTVHSGAEIRNVIIGENCVFTGTGNSGVAGIVGEIPIGWKWGNVVIENCGNLGKVTAAHNNTSTGDVVNAGGILGMVRNNTDDNVHVYVDNCFNMGTVTADKGNSALLCGYMCNSGIVRNCWSGGKLNTSSAMRPYDDTQNRSEFFVGYMDKLNIDNCFAIDPLSTVMGAASNTEQAGVSAMPSEALASGELAFYLNKEVTDGTQTWYQKLSGEDADPRPVLTKLPDGTNMVLYYEDIQGNIGGFANTSSEEITDVILGKKTYKECPVTDINHEQVSPRKVDITDLTQFIEAANK